MNLQLVSAYSHQLNLFKCHSLLVRFCYPIYFVLLTFGSLSVSRENVKIDNISHVWPYYRYFGSNILMFSP